MAIIDDWLQFQIKNNISQARLKKYVVHSHTIERIAESKLEDVVNGTGLLETVVKKINASHYRPWTKSDLKVFLKQIWKLKHGFDQDDTPKEIKWIKTGVPAREKKLPKDLLTDADIKAMIAATNVSRNKAIIMLFYECGLRVSELCALCKDDLDFVESGVRVHVPEGTKTGSRSILGIDCGPFLANWIASHPVKDFRAPLFVGGKWVGEKGHRKFVNMRMESPAVAKMLRKTAKAAGIEKRIYPHLFRHSCATRLAKFLTEQELKAYLGWANDSSMAAVYVHLSGKDVDDALLRMHGQLEPKKTENTLAPIFCDRCGRKNANDAQRCDKCGLPFDKDEAKKGELRREKELKETKNAVSKAFEETLRQKEEIRALEKKINLILKDKT